MNEERVRGNAGNLLSVQRGRANEPELAVVRVDTPSDAGHNYVLLSLGKIPHGRRNVI